MKTAFSSPRLASIVAALLLPTTAVLHAQTAQAPPASKAAPKATPKAAPKAAPAAAPTAAPAATPTAAPTPAAANFTLPALPYAYDALASVIDAQTMELHHQRHHGAQVSALNAAIAANPSLSGQSLAELLASASKVPPAVRNNAGGHWNHSFFWTIMSPPGQGGTPSAALNSAITRDFGSMDAFKSQFRAASLNRFGSGWAWVVKKADGKLAITSTPNQDNPLMDVADVRGTPILGNDVWEHAYYLKYQNKRADYVDAWWSLINWTEVSQRFEAAGAANAPPK
jgi:superoxide dismutase, Fe-Mn family